MARLRQSPLLHSRFRACAVVLMAWTLCGCHRLREGEGPSQNAYDYRAPQYAPSLSPGQPPRGPYGRHAYPRPVDPAMASRGQHVAWFVQARLGKPYCWGGTGPRCYDCSGLTYMAWKSVGKSIPRTSTAQHEGLARVSMDRLAAGDILWRPGHVGLYVGNGWAIHAPGRGKPVQFQPANKFRHAMRP